MFETKVMLFGEALCCHHQHHLLHGHCCTVKSVFIGVKFF